MYDNKKGDNELFCLNISNSVSVFDSKEYSGNNDIVEVFLPDNVVEIGESVFRECCGIKNVILSKNLKKINKNAFRRCKNLRKIKIPEGVERIEDYAFFGCEKLSKIVIPSSVKFIGKLAFHSCRNLFSIEVHVDADIDGLVDSIEVGNITDLIVSGKVINSGRFKQFTCLERLILTDGVEIVYSGAFEKNPNLIEIHFPKSLKVFNVNIKDALSAKKIDYYFHGTLNEWFENSNSHELIDVFSFNKIYMFEEDMWISPEKVIISDGVTIIKNHQFEYLVDLKTVILPDSVISIGDYAFHGCKSLKYIKLPKKLISIGRNAFFISGIRKIEIPNTITTINSGTFHCTDLEEVYLPDSVLNICEDAFSDCQLTRINLPKNLKSIGQRAFSKCSRLEKIVVPEGVTVVGSYAFQQCHKLDYIALPKSIEIVGQDLCKYSKNYTKKVKTIYIPRKLNRYFSTDKYKDFDIVLID